MNTQVNILHTGGNSLQQASSQADPSIRKAPEQTDQPISQQEANPDIQGHLAAAPGGMVEGDALSIAQDPTENINNRLRAAQRIKDDAQRDAVLFLIAQDPKLSINCHLDAAGLIRDIIKRSTAYNILELKALSLAKDPRVNIYHRLTAARGIQDNIQREAVYLSIAQDSQVSINCRLGAVKSIRDIARRDAASLSITQDLKVNIYDRLNASKLIQDDTQRDSACLSIAQNSKISTYHPLEAAKLIINPKIQEKFYPTVIANILSIGAFGCMQELITFVEKIPDTEIKNLVIKAICQNWLLVEEGQLQEHLRAFHELYELASDDVVRAELITAIVTRTEVDAGFRKAVVEEHVKDAEERDRLVKAIEEGQEGSLNGPRTKKAQWLS